MLRWLERDSWGCGVQVPAPKQSGEQGVLCFWAVSHLCFCLTGCGLGTPQSNDTEKETWTGKSPQPCVCKGWGAGGVLGEKEEQQGGKRILKFSHEWVGATARLG